MATVKTIIEKAYTKVNGEYEAIVENSDDFKTYLNVLNQVIEQWFDTPHVKWQSTFDMNYTLPEVVSGGRFAYTVPVDDEIRLGNTPLDHIDFIDENKVVMGRFKMVDQALFQATNSSDVCVWVSDGLYLKTVPDKIVGTRIRLPAYVKPAAYTTGSQRVKIDSTAWLVAAMAAFICDASPVPFIARNAEKFAKEADKYMKTMRLDNRRRQILSIKSPANRTITSLSEAIESGVGIGGGSFDNIDGGQF